MEPTGFIFSGVTGVGDLPAATIAVPLNAWTHIAVVRTSTSASGAAYYINGAPAGTFTISSNISGTASSLNVGTSGDSGSEPTNGYIANFRAVKGTAVYTGAFTPPSGPLTQTGGTYPSLTNVITGFSAANTSLLLNLADSNYLSATNLVQNNTFIDDSNYAFPITRNGTPTQGSITPYWPNGQWSNYFVASSSQTLLTTETQVIPTGNFTIELFVYVTSSTATQAFVSQGTSGSAGRTAIGIDNSSGAKWFCQVGGVFVYSSAAPTLNTWNYLAMTYNGTAIALYLNGALLGSQLNVINAQNSQLRISGLWTSPTAGYYLDGYLSNVRVSNTVRTVTSTPTAPFTSDANTTLLTCQGNRFVDVSGTPKTLTPSGGPRVQAFQPFSPTASYTTALYGGSGYFNGSTDYVSITDGTALKLGSGNFAIEGWVYLSTSGGSQAIYARSGFGIIIGIGSGSFVLYASSNGSSWDLAAGITFGTAVANTWTHFAAVRNGANITLYVNGVLGNTVAVSTSTLYEATAPTVGNWNYAGANWWFNGYASNLRVVKGTAVYTGAFKPPTLAPLATSGSASAASYTDTTNVNTSFAASSTSLLLNMTNAGIYDAAAQNDITTVADAKTDTTIKQWPLSSVKFDGTGDFLRMVDSPVFNFGSSDFTIEAWVYTASGSGQVIYSRETPTGDGILFQVATGLTLGTNLSSDGTTYSLILTGGSISASTWTYVAVTRVGSGTNNIKLFLGVTPGGATTQVAQGTFSGAIATPSGSVPIIGARNTNAELPFNGYIQDFRITRGVGRTISTVPSASFPTR